MNHLDAAINISQGSVATRVRCGDVYSHYFAAECANDSIWNTGQYLM